MITLSGKRRSVGRPRIDASVEKIIVAIKTENPRYGTKLISLMVSEQLGVAISQATVRNILKRQPRKPSKPTKPTSHENSQSWNTFLGNHRGSMASMDFKGAFDWRGKPLHILNIIDHDRRELVVLAALGKTVWSSGLTGR